MKVSPQTQRFGLVIVGLLAVLFCAQVTPANWAEKQPVHAESEARLVNQIFRVKRAPRPAAPVQAQAEPTQSATLED
jgi:hypothetical protein